MGWYISFAAVVVIIAATVLLMVKKERKGYPSRFQILFAGCFLTGVAVSVAPYIVESIGKSAHIWRIVILSVVNAIKAFGAEDLYAVVLDNIDVAPRWLQTPYTAVTLVVQVLSPILTFGFILSFLKNFLAYCRYCIPFCYNNVYAFSELNEKSLALASDIRKNQKRPCIVFADVYDDDEDIAAIIDEAKEIGAICFKKDIVSINFALRSKKKRVSLFTISEDEMKNVEQALKLTKKYGERENTDLYVFAVGTEGELLLAGIKGNKMRIRRIDEVRSLVYRLLYESGSKIFESAGKTSEDGEKQISAVIVGMGGHGMEMLKSIVWYCQMDGYRVKINAFDKDNDAEDRFRAICPEIYSEEYNRKRVDGEAYYDVTVHSGYDVNTGKFVDKLREISDASYVFISLGSDELNIQTAVNLRTHFERMDIHPYIHAILSNKEAGAALSKATNYSGQSYDISFTGDIETQYSENVIINSAMEDDAYKRHVSYCGGDTEQEGNFWRYEYCYRSSLASTVHAKARIECGIPGADKTDEEITSAEKEGIEKLEHRRWNAYMRSEGYIYSGSEERESRNNLAKKHNNLIEYSRLSEDVKRLDSKVGTKK